MSKTVSKYQHGFEQFYEDAGIKIMSDPEQHELAQLIQAPSEQVRAIFVDASAGTGKALVNDTVIQTPIGGVEISKLTVGDYVFGSDGQPHEVTGVYPQGEKQVYRVSFSDRTTIDCCEEHLWTYQTKKMRDDKKGFTTDSLSDIINNVPLRLPSGANNIYIPVAEPVQYARSTPLEVDPYVLGVLLGDGGFTENTVRLTNSEQDIIDRVRAKLNHTGYNLGSPVCRGNNNYMYGVTNIIKGKGVSFKDKLTLLGYEIGNPQENSLHKRVPKKYLHASVPDRLALLQGLIDTDGYCLGSSYEFYTSSKQLARDVTFLVEGLGMTVTQSVKPRPIYKHKGETRIGQPNYRLTIKTTSAIPKIHQSAKHESKWRKPQSWARRTIRKIEKLPERKEMTCISVNSPDKLFLTEHFIPTHNTTVTLGGGIYGVQNDRFDRIIYVRNSEPVEQVGFLPGDLTGKMAEAMAVCTETMDTFQPGLAKRMLELNSVCGQEKQLTLKPVAYLRGKDFSGSPLVIIDEAQNLNLHQLQTVLTRPHDSAKVVIIGSSKQVDPGNKERIGIDNLLAFTVFAKHYEWNPSMLTRTVQLTKNYRGEFSKYADRIQDTVRWLNHNSIYDKEGNEVNARLVSSNGNSVISRECEGYKCYTKERTYHD